MRVDMTQLVVKSTATMAAFAGALFIPAGTLAWPAGWALLSLNVVFWAALTLWLLRFDPELLAERLTGTGRADQKRWDKWFVAVTTLFFYAWFAVMAVDAARLRWSRVPIGVHVVGALLLGTSFWIFYLTFRENRYLSPVIRIQSDRAQTVVTTGPYRWVRHPMYAAFVLYAFGTAFLLGSWYGLFGALLLVTMIAWRAVREERVLGDELDGYRDYMTRVRYRLIPGFW